jgi:microcystin-dependent protein
MWDVKNRSELEDVTLDEFETFFKRLKAFLRVAHNDDGSLIEDEPGTGTALTESGFPVGALCPYGGTTAPIGWLLCDGSAINRVVYRDLFEVIGTSFGVGDGTTTFNVPDMRQKFPLGKAAAGTGSTLGGSGGAIDHDHTFADAASTTSSDGAHTHTGVTGAPSATTTVDNDAAASTVAVGSATHTHSIGSDGAHTHTVAVSGTTGTNNPPFLSVNYIIRAA